MTDGVNLPLTGTGDATAKAETVLISGGAHDGMHRQIVGLGNHDGSDGDPLGDLVAALGALDDDKSAATDATPVSQTSLLKQISAYLATLTTNAPTVGQKAMAASTPTALASNQSILSVVHDTTRIGGGDAGSLLTPQFATFDTSSSGDTQIVAAVTGKVIRVLALSLNNIGASAVTVKFRSDTGGTPADISGKKILPNQGDGYVQGFNPVGWFQTGSGKNLGINLSGAVNVTGEIVYVAV